MKKIRASSLPKLAECPAWESNPNESEAARVGTLRHKLLEYMLHESAGGCRRPEIRELRSQLEEHQLEAVDWAHDWIVEDIKARGNRISQMLNEESMTIDLGDGRQVTGTADVICGDTLYDLKFGQDDYALQFACYAVGYMDKVGLPELRCVALFSADKQTAEWKFTREEARKVVAGVYDAAQAAEPEAKAGNACKYCAKLLSCPTVTSIVSEASGVDVSGTPTRGERLNAAKAAQEWAKATMEQIKADAMEGYEVEGWDVRRQAGRSYAVASVAAERLGVSLEALVGDQNVSVTAMAAALVHQGLDKKVAKKVAVERIGDALQSSAGFLRFCKKSEK